MESFHCKPFKTACLKNICIKLIGKEIAWVLLIYWEWVLPAWCSHELADNQPLLGSRMARRIAGKWMRRSKTISRQCRDIGPCFVQRRRYGRGLKEICWGKGNATLCTGHCVQPNVANVHICPDMCAEVVFTICVRRCEWAEALNTCTPKYTLARLFAVFARFCAVAEAGGGMRRFYSHLQLCQLETILCNSSTRWLALVAGDVTGPRRPGWMRLQVRPLAVGANLPKHWRDGQKALEGRTIDDQASEVLWVLWEICPTSAGVVSDQLRRYVVCILWVPRSGMEECIYMVPLHIYVITQWLMIWQFQAASYLYNLVQIINS